MRNKKLEANVSMAVSKIFGGFNMNALKFLLPLWMSPLTGADYRLVHAEGTVHSERKNPVASVGGVGVVRLYVPLSYRVE